MLTSTYVVRPRPLSETLRHSLSHCLHRPYYRQSSAAFPPCIPNNELPARPGHSSQALPISPLLDASTVDAGRRLRAELPKPRQDASLLTPFQQRLAANPYARVLATPVRQCCFTAVKLPNHFLLPFTTHFRQSEPSGNSRTRLLPYIAPHTSKTCPGPKSSMVNSRALLRRLAKKRTWQRLVTKDMHDKFRIKDKKEWAWPDNMEHLVLKHLRQHAFTKLKWAFAMPNAKLIRQVDAVDACLADGFSVLRLRSSKPYVDHADDTRPPFDLPTLLGEQCINDLTTGTEFAASDAVALVDSPLTTLMLVRLSRLRAFLDDEVQ